MKKVLAILLVLVMALGLVACGNSNANNDDNQTDQPEDDGKLNVINLINGNLGDKSFFDSSHAGLTKLQDEGIINYKYIEMGATDADRPKYQSTLEEVSASGEYDIVVAGSTTMAEYVEAVAMNYPDQKYILYDVDTLDLPNVAQIFYSMPNSTYLVGMAAAWLTNQSDVENINEDKVIGCIGGGNIPVINDFIVGYIEGAQAVDPDIKVDVQYVGGTSGWDDPATAKELSNVMIGQYNCDIIFNIAGNSGNGMAEACAELGAFFIGVDSDQEAQFKETRPELSKITVTSALKFVGDSLYDMIKDIAENGAQPYGKVTQGGAGVVTTGNYETFFSDPEIADKLAKAQADIESGALKVDSAFDESFDTQGLINSVSPR